jgi:chaperone modulatory protein CbpM
MTSASHEWNWLDDRETVAEAELCRACAISATELHELIEYRAVGPVELISGGERRFSAAAVPALRSACKLRRDYDLDLFTVVLLMDLLRQIEALQLEVETLKAKLPGGRR